MKNKMLNPDSTPIRIIIKMLKNHHATFQARVGGAIHRVGLLFDRHARARFTCSAHASIASFVLVVKQTSNKKTKSKFVKNELSWSSILQLIANEQ